MTDLAFQNTIRRAIGAFDAVVEEEIRKFRARFAPARKALTVILRPNRRQPAGSKSKMPVRAIAKRFAKQQSKHGKKKPRTPAQKKQAERMRQLHADPNWRKKHGLPPPKK